MLMQGGRFLCLVRIILLVEVCRYTLWVEAYVGLFTAMYPVQLAGLTHGCRRTSTSPFEG